MSDQPPDLDAIESALRRIRPHVHRTPVMRSTRLDRLTGTSLFFKCENLQRSGSFKARGACNAVFSLDAAQAARGVVTHSSGNHAAAVAMAAGLRGIPAHIVMPRTAPRVKQEAVRAYGGAITLCAPTQQAREEAMQRIREATGAELIHPFEDARVIAGQGTVAIELLEEIPELDMLIAPISGGGLLSGLAIAAKTLRPRIRMVGAEPAAADDAHRSLIAGRRLTCTDPQTVADGLRMSVGEPNFPILQRHVEAVMTASEQAIIDAMRLTWEAMKLVIEPSSAVPLAALSESGFEVRGLRVGIVLTGGNVDLDHLPWLGMRL